MNNVVLGLLIVLFGLFVLFGQRWLPWAGNLPGDLTFSRHNSSFTVLLGTSLLVSVILSVVISLLSKR